MDQDKLQACIIPPPPPPTHTQNIFNKLYFHKIKGHDSGKKLFKIHEKMKYYPSLDLIKVCNNTKCYQNPSICSKGI